MKKLLFLWIAVSLLALLAGCAAADTASSVETEQSSSQSAPEPASDAASQPRREDGEDVLPAEQSDLLFDSMELDIERGTLYIRAGDAFSLTRHDGHEMDYEITGGVLYIDQDLDGEAVLTLPEGGAFTALRLTVGEGHVYAECGLSLDSLELNVAQGEATLSAISVAESSAIEVRRGAAFLSGDPGPSVAARSEEGHLSMEVSLSQDEYNFTVELSTGSIHFGDTDYRGRSVSKRVDNGAERSMELSCSRGDLSVEFDR